MLPREGVCPVHHCQLDLGERAWAALDSGSVEGQIVWDGGPALPVIVRYRGAHSRKFPRRSLQVTLQGARIPFGPPEGHEVRRIHLNADFIDPTLLRSRLSFALFEAVGAPAPVARHVAVTMGEQPAGVYVGLESVDRDFCRRRGWPEGPIFYAINRNANFGLVSPFTRQLKEPLEIGYQTVGQADPSILRQMLMELNMAPMRSFTRLVERWIDLTGYLRWLTVAVYVGNRDGFVHNYALCFNPDVGRFRIIPWDYDATFGIDINGRPARVDRVPLEGWNKLTHRILASDRFRQRYRQEFLSALDGPLHPDSVRALVDKYQQEIGSVVESDRGPERFRGGVESLLQWVDSRWALLRQSLLTS